MNKDAGSSQKKKGGVTRFKFVPYKRDDIILLRVKITLEP
jgi:hypothetical protein